VAIAPTTTTFAVQPVFLNRSARASVQVSPAAFAAAYSAFVLVGACAWPAEMTTRRGATASRKASVEEVLLLQVVFKI